MSSSRRTAESKQQTAEEVEIIKKNIILLNANTINNKDELFNSNPIKFKIQLDPREIKYIKEIELLPFYIPRILGLSYSDKLYITIDELSRNEQFHFVCMITVNEDTILVKPINTFQFSDATYRLRSNIMSVSIKLYDCTIVPLEYAFPVGVPDSMLLPQELINYVEEKKIHAELVLTYAMQNFN